MRRVFCGLSNGPARALLWHAGNNYSDVPQQIEVSAKQEN